GRDGDETHALRDHAARPRDSSFGIAADARQLRPGRQREPLRRLWTATALCLPGKPRGCKAGGRYLYIQQPWSWTPGAGPRGPIRKKLCRSIAGRNHGSAAYDRYGVETLRRTATAIPARVQREASSGARDRARWRPGWCGGDSLDCRRHDDVSG